MENKMTQQPKALWLADWLMDWLGNNVGPADLEAICIEAASELRNLYELSESEGRWASDYLKRAVKAESRIIELESTLKEMQDWEAIAADQAMTIAMLKITLLKAIEAMEIEEDIGEKK